MSLITTNSVKPQLSQGIVTVTAFLVESDGKPTVFWDWWRQNTIKKPDILYNDIDAALKKLQEKQIDGEK